MDDDAVLRETVEEILSGSGYDVRSVSCAEDALSEADRYLPHLLITDNMMPGIGGMALVSLMRNRFPALKIVMVTAYATVGNAVDAMKSGANDYLSKPFRKEELLVAVQKNLAEYEFSRCITDEGMDDTLTCLSHTMRRQILKMVHEQKQMRFMDITRALEIEEHTKVNFHLKILLKCELLAQTKEKTYILSGKGLKAISCLKNMSEQLQS